MRTTEITSTGLSDRLRSEAMHQFPCPSCAAKTTTLRSEIIVTRSVRVWGGSFSLSPLSATLGCSECGWQLTSENPIYASWQGVGQNPKRKG